MSLNAILTPLNRPIPFEIQFNTILISTPTLQTGFFSLSFFPPGLKCVVISNINDACYVPRQSSPPLPNHPNNNTRGVKCWK